MKRKSAIKDKISLNLSFLNIIFVISSINSYNFIIANIKNETFTDKLLYLIGFSFIPILISVICIILTKNKENKYQLFGFYTSLLTIFSLSIEYLIIILK